MSGAAGTAPGPTHSEGLAYLETLHHHFVTLDQDGRFQISGVPAGDYDFAIALYQPPVERLPGQPGRHQGRPRPGDRGSRPEGHARPGRHHRPGQAGPAARRGGPRPRVHRVLRRDREAQRPAGTIRPPRLLGHLVRPVRRRRCRRCGSSTTTYGADKRLVVLGLNLDDDPAKARQFVKDHPLALDPGIAGRPDRRSGPRALCGQLGAGLLLDRSGRQADPERPECRGNRRGSPSSCCRESGGDTRTLLASIAHGESTSRSAGTANCAGLVRPSRRVTMTP